MSEIFARAQASTKPLAKVWLPGAKFSPRFGARNDAADDDDDAHGDDATRLRSFGVVGSAVSADVRLGARRACVRV